MKKDDYAFLMRKYRNRVVGLKILVDKNGICEFIEINDDGNAISEPILKKVVNEKALYKAKIENGKPTAVILEEVLYFRKNYN